MNVSTSSAVIGGRGRKIEKSTLRNGDHAAHSGIRATAHNRIRVDLNVNTIGPVLLRIAASAAFT